MEHIFGKQVSREELKKYTGSISQVGGVTEYQFTTGKAKGSRGIDVRLGGLHFTVLPDRGMDIAWADFNGIPLSFVSKTDVTAPSLYDEQDFLRSFYAGLLTTCGLTYMGEVCEDEGQKLGLHGRIGNTPACDVSVYQEWEGEDFVIKIRGKMTEAIVFGEHMVLTREITCKLGTAEITINDTVENYGFNESPFMLLYHLNFGYPFIQKGTTLETNCTGIVPRDEEGAKGIDDCLLMDEPIHGYKEQVFYHTPVNNTRATLCNPHLNLTVTLEFDGRQLPYLIEWKQMGEGDYALGLEPATNNPEGRKKARDNKTLMYLAPQTSKNFVLKLTVGACNEEC